MTQKWVGSLVAITVLLMAVWSGVSAPSGTTQEDTFERPVDDRWVLKRGNASFMNEIGPANDGLTWMVLEDDTDADGTGASRIVANASYIDGGAPYWDTTRSSYTWSATLVQNASYMAPNGTGNGTTITPGTSTPVPPTESGTGPAGNSTPVALTPSAPGGATTSNGTIDASVTPNVTAGFAPLTVGFALGSTDANASTLEWTLDTTGNGVANRAGTGLPATRSLVYNNPGTYIAHLQVSDGNGTGNATVEIVVDPTPLDAHFSANTTSGEAPLDVGFLLDSAEPDAGSLDWTFDANGDGTPEASGTGLPANVTFTYNTVTTYTPRLDVTDGTAIGAAVLDITVDPTIAPLDASFTADDTQGAIPHTVDFVLSSNETSAGSLDWTFDADGDGTPDASGTGLPANVNFTYGTAGVYTALLEVTDGTAIGAATLAITAGPTAAPTLDDMIGITFGEQPGAGYYVAAFAPDRFVLGIPDASNGEFSILVDQPHWGGIKTSKMNMSERHKYEVAVDATTVSVYVDNGFLGSFALPGNAIGTYGVIAGEDEQVKIGETHWARLDTTPPTIDLWRPASGNIYVHDQAIPYQVGNTIYVHGELTLVAAIADPGVGVHMAHVYVDGDYKTAFTGNQTEYLESAFTIDTSGLTPGYHTAMVRAFDKAGNWEEERVQFYVISAQVPSVKTVFDTVDAAEGTLPDLPLP